MKNYQIPITNYQTKFRNLKIVNSLKIENWKLKIPSEAGFTLIELMVAIIIVGVIFGVIISAAGGLNRRGRDSTRLTDAQKMQTALQQYYADNHNYPQTIPTLANGAPFTGPGGRTYMATTPRDPSGGVYCYQPQVSQTNTTTPCDNAVDSTNKCSYFMFCFNTEDAISSATSSVCNGSATAFNYCLHSP